jgi:23S rRNA maturation-related 3'-5' exoribonuclease YhaM
MEKTSYFRKEISYIKDSKLEADIKTLIKLLPDYFFEIPASSTGKYHPKFATGERGLLKHTKVAVRIAYELLQNNTIGSKFTARDKDLIIMALILHDGLKSGLEKEKHTRFDHPLLISKYIMENVDKLNMDIDDIRKMCSIIESHMGEWTYDTFRKKEVLPKPITADQRFVHMSDLLASSKFLNVEFSKYNIKD